MIMPPLLTCGQLRGLLPLLALFVLACAGDPQPAGPATGEIPAAAVGPDQVAAGIVAATLGVDPGAVRILEIEDTVFGDASLDCPEPGMAYAQVLTPGHRVLAEADGRRFDVRVSGQSGRVCHLRRRVAPPPAGNEAAALARSALATLAGADESTIRILGSQPLRPGVPVADCAPCPAGSSDCGILVELELDERSYRFRVADGLARPCTELALR